jgi:2-oxoglutarate dehydrogenase E2 component (dihydrolipoamide succinyltransferase)
MTIDVRVPTAGESIREVQIVSWHKKEGDWIDRNEALVELETDKASMQMESPVSGTVAKILHPAGQIVPVGELIAQLDESAKPRAAAPPAVPASAAFAPAAAASPPVVPEPAPLAAAAPPVPCAGTPALVLPAAARALAAHGLKAEEVAATGVGGRLTKDDVQRHVDGMKSPAAPSAAEAKPGSLDISPAPAAPKPSAPPWGSSSQPAAPPRSSAELPRSAEGTMARTEETVPMTLIRRRIAQKLVEAQQTAALLTTFNEVEMQAVIDLRHRYRDVFQERHHVKLGFMSFFVKATVEALKRYPQINSEIRGDTILFRNYFDIGIAVGGERGLVVPVLRSAERMSFADIESTIEALARRARDNTITPQELQGGTFTITNGGIYGSLLSTPIVNPPQSGILGLHAIQDRPVARNGQVVIRPMMYLALTYDHRIVDGREAVGFLRVIKEIIEDPTRLFLEV